MDMINRVIDFSVRNKPIVFIVVAVACIAGWWSMNHVSLDAIPDLSETQVIIYSRWDRSPDIIEDQVTYPIVTAMLGAPHVKAVRGLLRFRLLLCLRHLRGRHRPLLGAFADSRISVRRDTAAPAGRQDRARALTLPAWDGSISMPLSIPPAVTASPSFVRCQDWYLRYHLKSVPGVAEVASIGGFVRQFQVNVDPNRLQAYGIPMNRVVEAVRGGNAEAGGRLMEFGGTEYMVRGRGYAKHAGRLREHRAERQRERQRRSASKM